MKNEEVNALPIVEADKDRISQVISNLLANAVKFTNEGVIRIAQKRIMARFLLALRTQAQV